jgi:HSP20 family molecular chaperone IbpA
MSAKWRRSNKNRKWLDFNVETKKTVKVKPKKLEFQTLKPVKNIHPASNYRPSRSYTKRKFQEPKPLIDIFQENNWITIVAEIAGFNKDTLKINVKDQKLTLSAKSKDRRYYKSLNLPKVVIPHVMHTTIKNGVLEIKLKKAENPETINKEAD